METILKSLGANFPVFAIVKMVFKSQELQDIYTPVIKNHNETLFTNPFPNSGFDLFVPKNVEVKPDMKSHMISMDVQCEMLFMGKYSCGYFMFPRSSLSKTPLMLANHTGIIDSGYRGPLIGAFRNMSSEPFVVEENTRLLQLCHSSLCPLYIVVVEEDELSTTDRGGGGFGSTGK